MKRSHRRILTTHVGRLQRPEELTQAMEAHPRGRPADAAFTARLKSAVGDVVRQQAEAGIDIVCDGEFGKLSWHSYLMGRLGGHEAVPAKPGETAPRSRDRREFAAFYQELQSGGSYYYRNPGRDVAPGMRWACTGPVSYIGREPLERDLANLHDAVAAVKVEEAFLPATSPVRRRVNDYYPHDDAYFEAVADAMNEEYRAIADAGFVVQIDDPQLPGLWDSDLREVSVAGIPQTCGSVGRGGEPRAARRTGRPRALSYLLGKLARLARSRSAAEACRRHSAPSKGTGLCDRSGQRAP